MGRAYPHVETLRLSDDERTMLNILEKRMEVSRAEVIRRLIRLANDLTQQSRPIGETIQLAEQVLGGMVKPVPLDGGS